MTNDNFNFNRCLKFVFTEGALGYTSGIPNTFVVEYNPLKNEFLCPRLEAVVTDTPAAKLKKRPGYEAELKIYNPSPEILEVISGGIQTLQKENDVLKYYGARLKVAVYAGYYAKKQSLSLTKEEVELAEKQKKDKSRVLLLKEESAQSKAIYTGTPLFKGYVNNSFFIHQGTDNILTLSCHDIDLTQNQANMINAKTKDKKTIKIVADKTPRAKPDQATFDNAFRWLITHYTDRYYEEISWLTKFAKKIREGDYDQYIEKPGAPSNPNDLKPRWLSVVYAKSISAYKTHMRIVYSLNESKEKDDWEDKSLADAAKNAKSAASLRSKNFYSVKAGLPDMLNELCAYSGKNLGYEVFDYPDLGTIRYVVYDRGNKKEVVSLNTPGVIKIVNFQNLISVPTVGANGALTIPMMFNRDCSPWAYIALVLDSKNQEGFEESGILNINNLNFTKNQQNQLIVPIGGTTNNAAVATTQLSTSMPVSAVAQMNDLAAKNGYLFNTPFLITRVVHRLSTHGKDWSSTVSTVPFLFGTLDNENT